MAIFPQYQRAIKEQPLSAINNSTGFHLAELTFCEAKQSKHIQSGWQIHSGKRLTDLTSWYVVYVQGFGDKSYKIRPASKVDCHSAVSLMVSSLAETVEITQSVIVKKLIWRNDSFKIQIRVML